MMDQRLISNQVFEGLQVPTLEEEPRAKSTILYANRYSGISEVDLIDPELLSVINSTVGVSGNNVLVQLKNKMATFRNGPWYIDSRNGVIHIHNRKHPEYSVYQYVYQHENGEVLSASFRMVEVFSSIAGLGGFVKAVSKAVGMLQAEIGKNNMDPPKDLPDFENSMLGAPIERPFSTWVSISPSVWEHEMDLQLDIQRRNRGHRDPGKEESKKKYKEYMAMSPSDRLNFRNKPYTDNYDAIDQQRKLELLASDPKKGNPKLRTGFEIYEDRVKRYGPNSPQAIQAKNDLIIESRKANITIQSDEHWSEWYATLTTKEILGNIHTYRRAYSNDPIDSGFGKQPPSPLAIQAAIDERIRQYVATSKIKNITNIRRSNYRLNDLGPKRVYGLLKDTFRQKYTATFTIAFFGYGSGKRKMNGERFIRGIIDRYSGSGGKGVPDASGMIRNAAANIGRGKKEKKLQASIRVIGNPILETGQQIEIQNVGKKHSGLWYIHQITHDLEHGRGYTTDMVLSRQAPKASASGTYSEIHTQSYTVDNESADPKSVKGSGRGTTSNKIRGKANVVEGNSEFSYQDAANVPWTLDEEIYARSIAHDKEALTEFTYRVADKNYYNKVHGTNHQVVFSSRKKNKKGEYGDKYDFYLSPNVYSKKDIPRKPVKSSQFDVVRSSANRRKK